MKSPRYRQVFGFLKSQIQTGVYQVGDYIPSENELCREFEITRTTARRALDELMKDGFIERQHGKGSQVRERRKSLGLLNLKGFSDAVGQNVKTVFLQKPSFQPWRSDLHFKLSEMELLQNCIHFERIRSVGDEPVMLENDWISANALPGFVEQPFIEDSFFKTLSQRYQIEIIGSEQELRAIPANNQIASLLKIENGSAILQINIRFSTSKPNLFIYAELYCNTNNFPVGNSYFL